LEFVAPESRELLAKNMLSGYDKPYEARILRKNGSSFPVEICGRTVPYRGGNERIAAVRDISERKQDEQERERLIRELQDALAKIKTLHGLLPICAHCKKIRDDKGSWNHLEKYVAERTEAVFSHGICPECAKKHYPEYLGRATEGNTPEENK
jgi:PAS domain-containing protein